MDRRSFLPIHSAIPWSLGYWVFHRIGPFRKTQRSYSNVCQVLYVPGPPEDDPDNLQRSRRTTAIQAIFFFLKWKDPTNPGNVSIHENFRDAVRQRATMAHQGQGYTYIPPQERTRQRLFDQQLRSQLRDECQEWSQVCQFIRGTQASPSSFSSSSTT